MQDVTEGFLIQRLYGTDFDPPVRLCTSAESLTSLVEEMGDVGREVFPESSTEKAALQLLFVHLEEELATRPKGTTTLLVDKLGVRWDRTADAGS